jgi:hypothetical protein
MSSEKRLGVQLPTSDELRAAIGPELQALARQALQENGEPSIDDLIAAPPEKEKEKPEEKKKPAPVQMKTVPLATAVANEVFAKATAQAKAQVVAPMLVPGVAAPAPAPVPAPAAAVSSRVAAPAAPQTKRPAAKEISKRDAPTAKVRKKKSSLPTIMLVFTGMIAAVAAGGAVWQAKKLKAATAPVARADTPATNGAPTTTSTEGAVKFVVPARPGEEPTPVDTTAPAEVKPPEPAPPPTVAAEPQPPATAVVAPPPPAPPPPAPPPPATVAAKDPPPKAHPHGRAQPPPADPPPAPPPKKTASSEEKKTTPAPAATPAGVDAILQQQLKSAIP